MEDKFLIMPEICFGNNALAYLNKYQNAKVLLVTDPFMLQSKMIDLVTEHLAAGNYQVFSDIVPDTPIDVITKGLEILTTYQPQVMVAVGGGSAIDTAKAMLLFAKKSGKINSLEFIAIPTTSGTGSEVTSFAVVKDEAKSIKYPLVDDMMLPEVAILEYELIKSVPAAIVADTGMDVLTHALESIVSTKSNEFTEALAEKAINLTLNNLVKSYQGDGLAKEKMHKASCLAGLAFNRTSLGINHSIAHSLGGKFKIPHGRANAILLPHVIEFNSDIVNYNNREYSITATKYSHIAALNGMGSSSVKMAVKNLINQIKKMQKQLKMPTSFQECGIKYQDFEAAKLDIAQGALEDACLATNPRPVSKNQIIEILNKCYGSKEY